MKKYRIVLCLLILVMLSAACAPLTPSSQELASGAEGASVGLEIHNIDVGQGDSVYIRLPDGKNMLIDAGEREYGERVAQYLASFGVKRIDYLVGTHPHSDHIGGLQHVVETFEIGQIYMPKKSSTTATFRNLLKAIQNKGLKVNSAEAGKLIAEGADYRIQLLSPLPQDYGDEMNLYSAVVKITYGKMRFLFMGDAETENEKEMQNVAAEFIRVGHHGSKTSSGAEFVSRVGAQIAVISVGQDNSYGLPKDEVLARWQESGATIYRTDKLGDIVFYSDGKSITLADGKEVTAPSDVPTRQPEESGWVLNTSSKKIHRPDCSAVETIKKENKKETDQSIAELEAQGYTACGTCDPGEG